MNTWLDAAQGDGEFNVIVVGALSEWECRARLAFHPVEDLPNRVDVSLHSAAMSASIIATRLVLPANFLSLQTSLSSTDQLLGALSLARVVMLGRKVAVALCALSTLGESDLRQRQSGVCQVIGILCIPRRLPRPKSRIPRP